MGLGESAHVLVAVTGSTSDPGLAASAAMQVMNAVGDDLTPTGR